MQFEKFVKMMQENFNEMIKGETCLFQTEIDKDKIWDVYLESFPDGTNPIFRERRVHDCVACKQFIRRFGGIVAIKDRKVRTIWDFQTGDTTYQPVIDALNNYVKSKNITDYYMTTEKRIGTAENKEMVDGNVITYHHMYMDVPEICRYKGRETIPSIIGEMRQTKQVFKRSLDEITKESVDTVLELINQDSLYRGKEFKNVVQEFAKYKNIYDELADDEKDLYAWANAVNVSIAVAKIGNHSIGVLLKDISASEKSLDEAVRSYEAMVAPENYKRPKPIFTKKMLEEAKEKIAELGYMDALQRRFANVDDITVNNILFSNRDVQSRMAKSEDVFDELMKESKPSKKKFSRVEEISIQDFVEKVLPETKSLYAFVEGRHRKNFVSLIAPVNKESKTMFKWNNGFSWAYTGNMTDSSIKENVKNAGGNVDGVLRFSIQWNELGVYNNNDFDAHCDMQFKNGRKDCIYYAHKFSHETNGRLDVDIVEPKRGIPAVENITWNDLRDLEEGVYSFYVHNYYQRNGKDGFRAEIAFGGESYLFEYNKAINHHGKVHVADIAYSKTDGLSVIKFHLEPNVCTKEKWNIQPNEFVPVTVVMNSPNYWDDQQGVGNKHYFFMLKDCINDEEPNGFYNEFLKPELEKHRHVFAALGGKMSVVSADDQLSGIGFSDTQREKLIVKVEGNSGTERVLCIKF